MPLFILTYDVRSTNHDYTNLYALLNSWRAAHLQNSVWLADMNGTAAAVRDTMRNQMHRDDTVSVIELPMRGGASWAAVNCRPEGMVWLRTYFP